LESILDFGFDVSTFVAESQRLTGPGIIVGLIALAGTIGRMLFVAFGSSIQGVNPFRNFSGSGLIILGIVLFIGALGVTGKLDKAVHKVQRNTIDPFNVWILKRDACDLSSGKYCVIVFEEGREISVNWFDREVYMWELLNPQSGAVWKTLRPRSRDEHNQGMGAKAENATLSARS